MSGPKQPSDFTIKANKKVNAELPFNNTSDFDDVKRGLIAELPNNGVIKSQDGKSTVWNLSDFDFLKGQAPDMVNPSLWRQAQLMALGGLFKVCDRVYQVRSADLSNMNIIEGKTGVIIVDPLVSIETAHAALELYYANRPKKPVVAVIFTHSHADHYGGVRGVINDEDIQSKRVRIIAPVGFSEAALSENLMAGNVMVRRATYMYGNLLPKNQTGMVGAGLGLVTSSGIVSFVEPTELITENIQKVSIDGLEFTFMLAPDTEAPAEMLFHLPELKALCAAEDATHTLHNLYTLRGAKTRDSKKWAFYLNKALELFGKESEVVFAQHHWPTWGNANVITFLENQRDAYQYLHDQTLRLANQGYTMIEIAEMLEYPQSLGMQWYNRGYYGSLNHDIKAVYNFYLGFFDGNPANLYPLPPVESSKRYVEFMGGADAVLTKAKEYFAKGEYRWVAQVVNHVVFADPTNQAARNLQADALEQLGYQTENGTWRNFFLTGAQELRNGVMQLPVPQLGSSDTINNIPMDMLLDYLGICLNGKKADGKKIKINLTLSDINETHVISIKNAVLHHQKGKPAQDADVSVSLSNLDFRNLLVTGFKEIDAEVKSGRVKIDGNPKVLAEFGSLLDKFNFWFNIIEP